MLPFTFVSFRQDASGKNLHSYVVDASKSSGNSYMVTASGNNPAIKGVRVKVTNIAGGEYQYNSNDFREMVRLSFV